MMLEITLFTPLILRGYLKKGFIAGEERH